MSEPLLSRHLHAVTDDVLSAPGRLRVLADTGLLDAPPRPGLRRLAELAARVAETPIALVSLVEPTRQILAAVVGLQDPVASDRQMPLSHSFCQHVVRGRGPLLVSDAGQEPLVADSPAIAEVGVIAYAGVPLTLDGEVLGSLCAIDHQPRLWTPEDVELLEDLAALAVEEIALARMARRLTELSRTDELTGLPNRHAWEGEAPLELARSRRHGDPVCMALIALDRNPRTLGRRGQPAGDTEVRTVTLGWRAQLRTVNLLARLDDDRFALMLAGTALDPAFACLQRLQRSVAPARMDSVCAVAAWRHPETLAELTARVEAALGRARRSGKPGACHLAI